jgi:ribosomal protein S2
MKNAILLKELLIKKAHIGTRHWNKQTSQFLLGFRSSPGMPLYGIFHAEKTLVSINEVLSFLDSFSNKKGNSFISPLFKQNDFNFTNQIVKKKLSNYSSISISQKASFLPNSKGLNLQKKSLLNILIIATNTSNEGSLQFNIPKIFSKFQISNFCLSLVDTRWVGGTLTNWKQVAESISVYSNFKKKYSNFLFAQNIRLPIHQRNDKRYKYLEPISKNLPDFIIVTNPEENHLALKEAKILKIPVIGFINSNLKPEIINLIDYGIPGNNKSPEFLSFCFHLFFIILTKNTSKFSHFNE